MACGCRGGGGGNKGFKPQQVRANLQSPRASFNQPSTVPVAPLAAPLQKSMVQQQKNFMPNQSSVVSPADRRRIQRLQQDAIRRSLNR